MRLVCTILALSLLIAPIPAAASDDAPPAHGALHRLLFYVPNRIFDVLDLVRARVRVGPGLSVDARATEALDVYLGAHTTLFAGLPGPRGEPEIPLPIGIDQRAGLEVSFADATGAGKPYYDPLEVGAGFQALLVGVEIGVAPGEALDLVLGLLGIDPVGDDF